MKPTIAEIVKVVAEYYHLSVEDIISDQRDAYRYRARQIVYYLTREMTSKSYTQIGQVMNRDHSTAIHGAAVIQTKVRMDETLAQQVEDIKLILRDLNPSLRHLAQTLHQIDPDIQASKIQDAVTKTGGTWQPPSDGFGDHQFCINLLHVTAYGVDEEDACRNWVKTARSVAAATVI